jgi:hypothetical protein
MQRRVSGKVLALKEFPAGNADAFRVLKSRRPKALRHHFTVNLPFQVTWQ